MAITHIHLASASPRRKLILEEHGFKVHVLQTLHHHEVCLNDSFHDGPEAIVIQNALLKTKDFFIKDQWILGGDTIVVHKGKEFGKPQDTAQAKEFLRELSGKTHQVFTGFCLKKNENVYTGYDISYVNFKDLSDCQIDHYVSKVYVLDKAGAYAVQDEGMSIIKTYEGSFYNIMGLCIEKIMHTIEHHHLS